MSRMLKLKDVCDINGGYAFKSTQYKCEGIPLIRIGDISEKIVNISSGTAYIDDDINRYDKFIVKKGDILIALSGATTGKFGMYNYEEIALLNQRVARISPKELVCNGYLFHYMNILKDIIYSKALGCAQPNISPTEISELDIYNPSIKEQEIIANILDKAQELIDKRKEQIEALDELVKSRFIEMFGDPISNPKRWNKEKMNDVAPAINYKGNFNEDKAWLLNLDMVESNTGKVINYNYVMQQEIGNSTCIFDTTNVLYSKLRPYLNKVVIPDRIGYATSEMVPLQPVKELLNRYYLTYMLRSKPFVDYISEKVSGAKMPRVSMNDFRNFEFPIPPIELQNQFADFVNQVDKLKFEIQNSLKELEDNFNSLMQKAFKGELFK